MASYANCIHRTMLVYAPMKFPESRFFSKLFNLLRVRQAEKQHIGSENSFERSSGVVKGEFRRSCDTTLNRSISTNKRHCLLHRRLAVRISKHRAIPSRHREGSVSRFSLRGRRARASFANERLSSARLIANGQAHTRITHLSAI